MIRYATFLFALVLLAQPVESMVQVGVDDGPEDDAYYYDYDGDGYWEGPGFYYGIWFDNEWEYNDWRRGHSYRNGRYYDRRSGGGQHHGGGGSHSGGRH